MTDSSRVGGSVTVAVVGATGQQGGATADALLDAGVTVRALVRDPDKPAAHRLAERGAEIVRVDLDDADGLVETFRGADCVFAMATFTGPDGVEGEIRQGRALGDAAVAAGVPRLVYSSVGGAERNTGIPHFESKRRIEEHLESLDLATVFVRPVFFMDNLAGSLEQTDDDGGLVVRQALDVDTPLQLVSVRDIGRVVAVAALQPDRIPGGAIEIGGDELTGPQLAAVVGEVTGRPARFEELPIKALPNDDLKAMYGWFRRPPAYQADFDLTRELVPDVLDFRGWLAQR